MIARYLRWLDRATRDENEETHEGDMVLLGMVMVFGVIGIGIMIVYAAIGFGI